MRTLMVCLVVCSVIGVASSQLGYTMVSTVWR